MIFVTTGAQLPFPRLINSIVGWLKEHPSECAFIQSIGIRDISLSNISYADMLSEEDYRQKVSEAELIIAHAGTGSIISAMHQNKTIVIVPRISGLGEHRNDHQLGTLKFMKGVTGVYIAHSNEELFDILENRRNLKSMRESNHTNLLLPELSNLLDKL